MTGLALEVPEALVEAIARRVVELLRDETPEPAAVELLTVEEAAGYLRAKRQRIYDLASDGRLTPQRDGRRLLFRREDLDAHLAGETA